MSACLFEEVKDKTENINKKEQLEIIKKFVHQIPESTKEILIIPPDYTRKHSGTGELTSILYELLKDKVNMTIMPALGTHRPMTEKELINMFGKNIPLKLFKTHDYINDTVHIGTINKDFVKNISQDKINSSIDIHINKELLNEKYDLVISIGQVLPHGVVGMSNYNKNILIGCGGRDMINISHYVGAAYGMEKLLGKDHSPVRKILDFAENKFLKNINIHYILTVNSTEINPTTHLTDLLGVYIGKNRKTFERAVKASQQFNITYLDNPVDKMVVYMDETEFKTTWLACKAIYRTRLVIKDGGELLILAPGLKSFGENKEMDRLIRKYGYRGRNNIFEYVKENNDLQSNLAVAAHLIHGSSENRFKVTYATDKLSKEELEKVNFEHISYKKISLKYNIDKLKYGYNKLKDEEIFYIENPATGLWMLK